ncbi:hypothetical protein Tco_0874350 [Tanacetum coccineum]|uniref:Uncharacterized protein n=1 Tax=Tanacetum coccineum TaxID=301880 RepID=A0ABQ5BQJ6_9ASTR
MFSSNQRHWFHCKDVLGDGEFCQRCTCMRCGSGLSKGLCLICASRYGNNPNPNSLNDSPNISENVSQSPPLIDHHCCYECEEPLDGFFCQQCTCKSSGNSAHYGYNCPPQVPIISNPEPCNNQTVDELPQTLPSLDPTCYSGDGSSFTYYSTPNFVNDSPNIPICYDDDDDEYSFATQEYLKKFSSAITPDLPKSGSLIMEDKHLDTILETESDELIKSSVEDLVHTPSESEDFSDIESECDVPDCDDSQTTNFSTFSNPLFDDSTSRDDDSSHEERLLYDNSSPRPPKDFHANPNTIIESLPTFPIPVEDSDSLREEIDIFPSPDDSIPPGIESDDYDSEGDDNSTSLPEFESFHVDYPDSGDSTIDVVEDIPVDVPNILPTHPTLHMDFDFIPSHNDLGSDLDVSSPSGDRNKIYDPGICIEVESTRFLATLSPVIDTLLPFSSENKDKVFNHGVLASKEKSPPSSSHRGFKASKLFHHKSPMLIYGEDIPILDVPFLHFYPP